MADEYYIQHQEHLKVLKTLESFGIGDGTQGYIDHTDEDGTLKHDALTMEGDLIFGIEAIIAKTKNEEREVCAKMMELSDQQIRLMAGEMTAQEMRTVKAILKNRATVIREGRYP